MKSSFFEHFYDLTGPKYVEKYEDSESGLKSIHFLAKMINCCWFFIFSDFVMKPLFFEHFYDLTGPKYADKYKDSESGLKSTHFLAKIISFCWFSIFSDFVMKPWFLKHFYDLTRPKICKKIWGFRIWYQKYAFPSKNALKTLFLIFFLHFLIGVALV